MRPWLKKTLRWSGITLVVLAALYAGAIAYSFHVADQAVARWRAAGFPTTFEELLPPVPDEQNAVIVLQQLATALGKTPVFAEQATKCMNPRYANDASCTDFLAQHRTEIDAWLEENAAKLSMLDDALATPTYYISYEMHADGSFSPVTSSWANPTYFLAVIDYCRDIQNNDIDSAVKKISRLLKYFSMHEKQETDSFGYSITILLHNNVLSDLEYLGSHERLSKQQVTSCLSDISAINMSSNYKHSMTGCLVYWNFGRVLSIADDPLWTNALPYKKFIAKIILYAMLGPSFVEYNHKKADMLATHLTLHDLASSQEFQLADTARDIQDKLRDADFETSMVKTAFVAMAVSIAKLNITKVRLALLLHKLTHGSYPETLDALDPAILSPVPHDIFAKQPFMYELDGNGTYTLSSPGFDALPFRSEYEYPRFQ